MDTPFFKRPDTPIAAALFLLALGVYIRTLCPTLYWGDCGELATVAYTLGIAHPTGYPAWTLLAKGWSLLFPFGTFLWRLNLLSALFGALAVTFLYGAARTLALPRPVAFTAAGLFAFSATFWQQCTFAETYSLTACSTAAMLFFALRWQQGGCPLRGLRPLAFAAGFALTNGQINSLFLPGFVLFLLYSDATLRQWRTAQMRREWLRLAGLACVPLLAYAYLPLRARMHPAVNWGDPSTPFAFWYHVTGRTYAPMMFHQTAAESWQAFSFWARSLSGEYAWPVVALAVLGWVTLWKRNRPAAALLAWIMVADVTFTVNYPIYNHYIYFIPCYIALALLFGTAAQALWQRVAAAVEPARRPALGAISAASLILLVPFQAAAHWQRSDLHRSSTCYDYGHDILASIPENGILIDSGQDTSQAAIMYLQHVEHYRPDVVVVQRQMLSGLYDRGYGRWTNLWYWDSLRRQYPQLETLATKTDFTPRKVGTEDLLRRLIAQAVASGRPVTLLRPDGPMTIDDGQGHFVQLSRYMADRYDLARIGLLTRVYPRGQSPAAPVLLSQTQAVWRQYRTHSLTPGFYQWDGFLTPIAIDYADAGMARARLSFAQGDYDGAEDGYRTVLLLFRSEEAADGLARCAQARTLRKRVASSGT